MPDGKKVEVKVHRSDTSSIKGAKIKKSLVELSDYTIVMYVATNLRIRNVLLLDSEFVVRKFSSKGHNLLKDVDVHGYFFTKSNKQFDKIINRSLLMKFATPNFAMKLDDMFSR